MVLYFHHRRELITGTKKEEDKMKKNLLKALSIALLLCMVLSLTACGSSSSAGSTADETPAVEEAAASTEEAVTAEATVYKVGICNYVDDASLNQIVENLQSRLEVIGEENGCEFEIYTQNCNADAAVMEQIIQQFIADGVDAMVGVATPVAMTMQADTEENQIPVIFAAVSDPLSAGLVDSLEAPGANITGTSDFLNTDTVLDLIFAQNPDAAKIGLLYDIGQDSSATPIAAAKEYLDAKGVEYVEATGTNNSEVLLAAQNLVADGVDAVFTPTDNTIMTAELSIYETFAEAGIPHYCGADSFALNGAFLGFGVDYANLGSETADMVAEILINGANPAELSVMTFDNGTASINKEICEALGYDFDTVSETFAPYCTQIVSFDAVAEAFE